MMIVIDPGVRIAELTVRNLTDAERAAQAEQITRAAAIAPPLPVCARPRPRMPVPPARAVIGRYGVRWVPAA